MTYFNTFNYKAQKSDTIVKSWRDRKIPNEYISYKRRPQSSQSRPLLQYFLKPFHLKYEYMHVTVDCVILI